MKTSKFLISVLVGTCIIFVCALAFLTSYRPQQNAAQTGDLKSKENLRAAEILSSSSRSSKKSGTTEQAEIVWEFEVPGGDFVSAAAIEYGEKEQRVFVADRDGVLYALDLKSGDEKWRFSKGGAYFANPVVNNGLLVIGDDDGAIRCFESKTGICIWEKKTEYHVFRSSNFLQEQSTHPQR